MEPENTLLEKEKIYKPPIFGFQPLVFGGAYFFEYAFVLCVLSLLVVSYGEMIPNFTSLLFKWVENHQLVPLIHLVHLGAPWCLQKSRPIE